jgi:hypothetical protein
MAREESPGIKIKSKKVLRGVWLNGSREEDAKYVGTAENGLYQRKRRISGSLKENPEKRERLHQIKNHERSDCLKRNLLLQYFLVLLRQCRLFKGRHRNLTCHWHSGKGRDFFVVNSKHTKQGHGRQKQPKMLQYVR